MAAKKSSKKMSLQAFLVDDSTGSWADDVNDLPTGPSSGDWSAAPSRDNERYAPPAPRSGFGDRDRSGFGGREQSRDGSRGFDRRDDRPKGPSRPIPSEPPFTAFVGNLSYDIAEEDLADFFGNKFVKNVRILMDRDTQRPKGFGYVEFTSVEALVDALELSGTDFKGRSIRVDVAEPPKDRPSFRRDERDDRTSTASWRRETPLPPRRDDRERRDGPRGFGDRDRDGAWGGSRSRPGGFGDRERNESGRGFGERGDRGGRGFGGARRESPERDFSFVGERRKLQLAPRTKPVESEPASSYTSAPKRFNPFGDAKPVDTAQILKKVEEKLHQTTISKTPIDEKE